MNILQRISTDHYEEMLYILHPRKSIIENVDKMLNCGNPSFGGAMYFCPDCGNLKFIPFRCHSRFCPTCGNKYSISRTTSMSFKIINVKHRHCVFTIAEELRPFFLKDRSLLNCLFSSVRSVIMRLFHKDNKTELFTPGFICVLHTFGRDLKWNLHIHCLISEGGVGTHLIWKGKKHFNFECEYVTFHYNRHEDDKLVVEKIPDLEFIGRLIRHIPEKHFKMIRYYGVYAIHRQSDKNLSRAISKEKHKFYISLNTWGMGILSAFSYNPLKCSCCGATMEFLELYYNHHLVSLDELYKKVMAKSHACRSHAHT